MQKVLKGEKTYKNAAKVHEKLKAAHAIEEKDEKRKRMVAKGKIYTEMAGKSLKMHEKDAKLAKHGPRPHTAHIISRPRLRVYITMLANGAATEFSSIIYIYPLALYAGADPCSLWWGSGVYICGRGVLIYADTGTLNRSIRDSFFRGPFPDPPSKGRKPPGLGARR